MIRICQLRRSFSLDFVNDDSATVFLHEEHNQVPIQHKSPSPYLTGPTAPPPATLHSGLHPGAHLPVNMSTSVHWQDGADIDDALAADFDGSLSGLGMELGTSSFNMSEALMALPSVKNEHHFSPGHSSGIHHRVHKDHINDNISISSSQDDAIRPVAIVHGKKNRLAYGHDEDSLSSGSKRFCVSSNRESDPDPVRYSFAVHQPNNLREIEPECDHEECASDLRCHHRHSNSAPDLRTTAHILPHSTASSPSPTSNPSSVLTQILSVRSQCSSASTSSPEEPRTPPLGSRLWNQFQYILCASTSMATKVHEETMTYLNQGQSYEIKLKKLGDLTEMRGKKLRSIVKVGFHERRLQFMEKDLINQWRNQRQTERILEIDIPLSYGINEIIHDPIDINKCYFSWEPTKETGIYVKVNCISTEFTPKKHGGEKGVPFRVIVETHAYSGTICQFNTTTAMHAASCQVKVFKPKGADRKHKTDREKMGKRGPVEQEKYQPSYECTVFTEYPVENIYTNKPDSHEVFQEKAIPILPPQPFSPTLAARNVNVVHGNPCEISSKVKTVEKNETAVTESVPRIVGLSPDASPDDVKEWLHQNRLETVKNIFSNFTGADLLRLTRDEAIEICGLADGIRFYNALHSRKIRPRLTLYINNKADDIFRAIYFEQLTVSELINKLTTAVSKPRAISNVCLLGPSGIKGLITDEVVQNLPTESMYQVEMESDENRDTVTIILKQYK